MILDGSRVILWSLPRWQAKLGIGGGVPPTRQINTQAPLIGGGDLSADRLLILPQSSAGADGYLSAGDFAAFAAKENPLTFTPPVTRVGNVVSWTGDTDDVPEASNLYFTDTRARAAFSATAPVALSAGGVISMPAATSVVDGYLTAASFASFTAKVATSRAINTTSPLTGGGDLSGDRTLALDLSTSWTWTANGIAATPNDRVILSNTTAAAAGAQQYSPALRLTGQGWGTTAGTSQATDWRIYNQPVQGAVPTTNLLWQSSIAGGAFATKLTLDSNGQLTSSAALVAGTGVTIANSSPYNWVGRSKLFSDGDGQVRLSNQAGSDFTRLQFGGVSSSFPALGRSTTFITVGLADGTAGGGLSMSEGANIVAGTTTGTKIGTVGGASGQKLAFFGSAPIVQPVLATGALKVVDDVITVLQNLGLCRQS